MGQESEKSLSGEQEKSKKQPWYSRAWRGLCNICSWASNGVKRGFWGLISIICWPFKSKQSTSSQEPPLSSHATASQQMSSVPQTTASASQVQEMLEQTTRKVDIVEERLENVSKELIEMRTGLEASQQAGREKLDQLEHKVTAFATAVSEHDETARLQKRTSFQLSKGLRVTVPNDDPNREVTKATAGDAPAASQGGGRTP